MRQFSAMPKAALGFISRRRQLSCIRHGSILGPDEIIGNNRGLDVLRPFSNIAGIGARGVVNEDNIVDKGILKWDVSRARIGAQQTRGFMGYADGDEDSGIARTYEEKRVIGSVLPEEEFHKLSDDFLHNLQEKLEEYGDDLQIDGFDLDYASGVLTVKLGDLGTYVINKQTANRQIWLSSPMSGPARFDWDRENQAWIYRRTKANLLTLMETELSNLLNTSVTLAT